jgi:GT2 family glycosyltransferase
MGGITAVIPNWNRREHLVRLIGELRGQTHPPNRILVVDNGSSDGSPDAAESLGATVIRLPQNLGFAPAVNRGVQAAATEWIALLNNDVRLAPDWLQRLHAAVDQPDVWFGSGKLLQAANPRLLDGSFDLVCRGGCAWRAGSGRPDGPLWSHRRRIDIAPMTAALFRRDLFYSVGWLDERLGSYLEDVDFGLRCLLAGKSGVYEPAAVAYHTGSATLGVWSAQSVWWISRNQALLRAKYGLCGRWPAFVAQILWGLLAFRRGAWGAYLKGRREARRILRDWDLAPPEPAALESLLREHERQIRDLQRRTGSDLFWRLYFALT